MSLFEFISWEEEATIAEYLDQHPEKVELVYRIACYNCNSELVGYLIDRGFPMESDYILECFFRSRKSKRSKKRFLLEMVKKVPFNKAIIEEIFHMKLFVLFKYFHKHYIYSPIKEIYLENIDRFFSDSFYIYCCRTGIHVIEFLLKNGYPLVNQQVITDFLDRLNKSLGYVFIDNNKKLKYTREFLNSIPNIADYENIYDWLNQE